MPLETTITRYFGDLEDPRVNKNKKHPLINIITIALCSVLSGADTWIDMERYGKAKQGWFNTFLDLTHGIPSHDTINRVFRWLNPAQFQQCFLNWAQAISQLEQGEVIAIDGKKLRGSKERLHDKDGIWMVSAWAANNNLVLGQEKVAEKSNEITAIPVLLQMLDIAECVVTIDAIGTQTAIVDEIVRQDADYILPVKDNQKKLREDIETLFAGFEADNYNSVVYDTYKQLSSGHDREEIRQCWVVDQPEYIAYLERHEQWSRLRSVAKMMTVRTKSGKTTITNRYFISSLPMNAQRLLKAVRSHWQIENGLHWVLDIAFEEDCSRIRAENAAHNFATLRHIATNLLKQEKSVKVGVKAKRKMAGWDNDYLLKVLGGSIT